MNSEIYGKPTNGDWGVVFVRDDMIPRHPTQLYEAGAEFFLFMFLLWIRRGKVFHGQLLLVWLGAYPVIRSVIELFRGDKGRGIYILSTSQYISIGIALVTVVLYFKLRQKRMQHQVAL